MSDEWTLVWVDGDESALREAGEFLARVESDDGFSAVSDQAKVAARRGSRRVLTIQAVQRDTRGRGDTGITACDTSGEKNDILAVGIVGEGELDLVVHPEHRGQGHGTRALAELLAKTGDDSVRDDPAHGDPGRDDSVKAWVHGDQPAAVRLLERRGFAPVRTLLRLELDPTALPLEPPAIPVGFTIRHFDPANDEDAAALVRVNAAAFANHPEQGSLTLEGFPELTKESWFRPEDLVLCFDTDGNLAGFVWNKVTGTEAELYVLAVDPTCAGRGLGRVLLGLSLVRMREGHPERVSLYVEADNEAALRLYERAGFTVARRSQQWLL